VNVVLYSLSSHASACATKRHWIILDTRSDRYFSLDRAHFDLLAPSIQGISHCVATDTVIAGRLPAEAAGLARSLVERGILEPYIADNDLDRRQATVTSPTTEIDADFRRAGVGARVLHIPDFLWACARADRWLRRRSIDWIVRRVALESSPRGQPGTDFDGSRATRLVQIFNALRPIYPRDYLCMFDSLALLLFLAVHRIYPRWVFGVCADPFKAHCWLQSGDVLLDDTLPTVSVYTPIMSI
jgi:hypothetical protein